MTRVYLIIQGLIMLAFGVSAMLDPISLTSTFGLDVDGRHGVFEMRGIYGGVSIGAGLLFLAGAWRHNLASAGLLWLVAYMGGYMIARVYAIIVDGAPEPYFFVFIGYEAVSLLLSLWLLTRQDSV